MYGSTIHRCKTHLRVQRYDGHDDDEDERPGDEEDVEAAVGARGEPDVHQNDEREAEQVAEDRDGDQGDPAAALVLVGEPGVVPLVDEVEEGDQLDEEEDAGAKAGDLACGSNGRNRSPEVSRIETGGTQAGSRQLEWGRLIKTSEAD
jgi:hypothetical protein